MFSMVLCDFPLTLVKIYHLCPPLELITPLEILHQVPVPRTTASHCPELVRSLSYLI